MQEMASIKRDRQQYKLIEIKRTAHQYLTWFGQCDLRPWRRQLEESTNQKERIQEITTQISLTKSNETQLTRA